ncbi:unnamed protein product [Calicophoron daubneyi]|uniref:Uncharacterized protein n=1 Tax=Calicophoron daubneyi TaxID=300641 RepID=A0AAV2TDR5_CALDB
MEWQKNDGGFWNTHKVVYSKETKDLLKNLMNESRVSNTYRQTINRKLSEGESLDRCVLKDDTPRKGRELKKTKPVRRSLCCGLRTKSMIDALKKNDDPPYRPSPVPPTAGAPEKERLAYLMAYGRLPDKKHNTLNESENNRVGYLRRKLDGERKTGEEESDEQGDRFDELIKEVKERRSFLENMEAMGKEKSCKQIIETEISQLVREMEEIDKKRSAELEKIIGSHNNTQGTAVSSTKQPGS